MNKKVKTLIISIGTGRSGSASLSSFLSAQKKMLVLHEGRLEKEKIRKLFKWENDDDELFKWLDYLINYDDNIDFIGDTGMYFLTYIDSIIKKYNNVKIIGLEREKKEVINSFLKKTKGRNHWYSHNGKDWSLDERWDPCFPKYPIKDKKKAIAKYYDDYIKTTKNLRLKYPNNIKIWSLSNFNTQKTKNEILDFISFKNERIIEKDFVRNTKLKSYREFILKKIKEWFSV
tara:strand:- start:324 stop:1016 length:693 start_codon:yes stop_codon:yes gene_type:complete